MDSRHQIPVLSYSIKLDWTNPLFCCFVGVIGSIVAAIILVIV